MNILTINAGSSSIKYKAYSVKNEQFFLLFTGLIEGIGETNGGHWHHQEIDKTSISHEFVNHNQAFEILGLQLNKALTNYPLYGIGHRVVHGGNDFYQPTLINAQILLAIKNLANLAPIHNPINALGIEFGSQYFPKTPQVAIFDTGFHHTMPNYAHHYPINQVIADRYQIKRYGFHGINHEYVAQQAANFLHKPLTDCNFITLHLGNGASACLIENGQSVDTSMGMTPLAGLMMGTRCGDIDPAIVLYLIEQGLNPNEIDKLLNKQSGLLGIGHHNDMRDLLARADNQDEDALLAITMYVYIIQKTIGAYYTQLPSLDALIFTGGVGENAQKIRELIIKPLQHLGFVLDKDLNQQKTQDGIRAINKQGKQILIVRGDEELLMAQKVFESIQASL